MVRVIIRNLLSGVPSLTPKTASLYGHFTCPILDNAKEIASAIQEINNPDNEWAPVLLYVLGKQA
jgi:hypothetical protein